MIEKARENMHRKHPKTRFVNAHMAMLYYDPQKLAAFLDTYPNADIELSATLQDLGRAPRLWREFIIKYQDRVLMGSDGSPGRGADEFWIPHWRYLETYDEYFYHPAQIRTPGGSPGHGRWNISGIGLPDEVLRKVYYQNALRHLPSLRAVYREAARGEKLTMNVAARAPVKHLAFVVILTLSTALPTWAQVKLTQGPEQIAVAIDGKPFTVFYIGGKDLNRPYLHPLRSASGKIVNRSFPAGQLPGETTDHPHHAGLFYGHGDVNGYNYWAIQNVPTAPSKASATMGRIVLKDVVSVKSGKESGSMDVVLTWLTPDGKPLLTETRKMTFHAHPELRIIDFDFDFAAIDKVVFRDTKEGTFAMRIATALDEPPRQGEGERASENRGN